MRWRYLGALGAFAAVLATPLFAAPTRTRDIAEAQLLPPPFGAPLPGPRSCPEYYQRLLKLQAEGMRQLQRLSRGDGEKLCSALENADVNGIDKLIDPKALEPLLTPDQRELLGALGIDLNRITQQCRQHQGDLERFATSELGRLEEEMLRCDDRI